MRENMKFVIVGCGRIATLHVAGYQDRDDALLFGVYDKRKPVAAAFAKKYGIPRVYDSFEEVLSDPDVTGVELLVPHHLHCDMAVKACEAKKHVSVQKPMAMNIAECDRMIEAARLNGVKLKVFENFVHYPPYKRMKSMIERGEIGDIKGIRYKMNNCSLNSVNQPAARLRARSVEGADKLPETGWKVDPGSWVWRLNDTLSGGGPLIFDDGYHKFSLFYDLFGSVESVFAMIDETTIAGNLTQDCPAVMLWKYADKKLYGVWDVTSSDDMYIQSKYYTCDERMEVTGSRGVLWLTRCTATLMPSVAPVVMYRDGALTEFWDDPSDWQDAFRCCTHDFIDAIKEDREPVLSGETGREGLRFALAAIESAKTGKPVVLNEYADKEVPGKKSLLSLLLRREGRTRL